MVPPLSSDSRAEPANPAASATATRPPMRSPSSTTASATVNKLSVASSNAPCVAAVCTRPKSKSRIASPGSRMPRANTGMLGREGRAPRASAAAHKTSVPIATSTANRSSGLTSSSATFVRAADSPHDSAARSSRPTGHVRDLAILYWSVQLPYQTVQCQMWIGRAVPPALGPPLLPFGRHPDRARSSAHEGALHAAAVGQRDRGQRRDRALSGARARACAPPAGREAAASRLCRPAARPASGTRA